MQTTTHYPIGTPGTPWGAQEKQLWLTKQEIKRSYEEEVVTPIKQLTEQFEISQYGRLDYAPRAYSLFALKSRNWNANKPNILVTGGIHGYETSGIHGALRFTRDASKDFANLFNFLIVPCVSPWGYETINRWNPAAVDPNRSFFHPSTAPESHALQSLLKDLGGEFLAHFDLHETTDTDNSEFRPALGARDGIECSVWQIPDGFYTVGDANNPCPAFQRAIIDSVRQVTHIAPADAQGKIIGVPTEQPGVINYPYEEFGLCGSVSGAKFTTTTEVYPDSPKVDPENCIIAQVAAICGGLSYITKHEL